MRAAGAVRRQMLREMRREQRHRLTQATERLRAGRTFTSAFEIMPSLDHAGEHMVARAPRGVGMAIGPLAFRRLRQRDQQRRFASVSERGSLPK